MLRMSKLTDYGIVLLTYFVADRGSLTARDLAEESQLPLPTVGKVLKLLSRGEILVSQRGVKGGYTLARPPAQITIAEVIRVLEGAVSMTECTTGIVGLCDLESNCPLTSNWRKINDAVLGALRQLTLADMSRPLPRTFARRKNELVHEHAQRSDKPGL